MICGMIGDADRMYNIRDRRDICAYLLSRIEEKLEVLKGLDLSEKSLRKIYEIYIWEKVLELIPSSDAEYALFIKEATLELWEEKSAMLDGQRNCYKEMWGDK